MDPFFFGIHHQRCICGVKEEVRRGFGLWHMSEIKNGFARACVPDGTVHMYVYLSVRRCLRKVPAVVVGGARTSVEDRQVFRRIYVELVGKARTVRRTKVVSDEHGGGQVLPEKRVDQCALTLRFRMIVSFRIRGRTSNRAHNGSGDKNAGLPRCSSL